VKRLWFEYFFSFSQWVFRAALLAVALHCIDKNIKNLHIHSCIYVYAIVLSLFGIFHSILLAGVD